jgi:hypothetical protein
MLKTINVILSSGVKSNRRPPSPTVLSKAKGVIFKVSLPKERDLG